MIDSYSITNDVSSDRANEIKVDIPETGISVSDAWRYLRRWLGHERHLTGNLRKLDDGRISLSLSLDGADAVAAAGKPSDLPALEQKAAEDVFGGFDPVNHINYLTSRNRRREEEARRNQRARPEPHERLLVERRHNRLTRELA